MAGEFPLRFLSSVCSPKWRDETMISPKLLPRKSSSLKVTSSFRSVQGHPHPNDPSPRRKPGDRRCFFSSARNVRHADHRSLLSSQPRVCAAVRSHSGVGGSVDCPSASRFFPQLLSPPKSMAGVRLGVRRSAFFLARGETHISNLSRRRRGAIGSMATFLFSKERRCPDKYPCHQITLTKLSRLSTRRCRSAPPLREELE